MKGNLELQFTVNDEMSEQYFFKSLLLEALHETTLDLPCDRDTM